MNDKAVLDREDVRTLVRIAHEIVEKAGSSPSPTRLAVVGIHRRGAVLAARLRDLVAELVGEPVARSATSTSASTATTSVGVRHRAPVVHASHVDFSVDDTAIVLVDDVLYTGRTVRAAIDALFDFGRPPARAGLRCSPTAVTASCRSDRTSSGRTCRQRAPRAGERSRRGARRGRRGCDRSDYPWR